MDSFLSLGTYIITYTNKTDDNNIIIDLILYHRLFGITKAQYTHRLVCKCVDLFVKLVHIYILDIAVGIKVLCSLCEKSFGSALVEGLAQIIYSGLAELVSGVEALICGDFIFLVILQCIEISLTDEVHQSLICEVTADDIVVAVEQ